jgi:hypothetical protein
MNIVSLSFSNPINQVLKDIFVNIVFQYFSQVLQSSSFMF